MTFSIKNISESPLSLARKIGYRPTGVDASSEYSIVRELSRNGYPRFHIYLKRTEDEFVFNLHLDQKSASYEHSGAHAHSGEYDGELVENEAERIKKLL